MQVPRQLLMCRVMRLPQECTNINRNLNIEPKGEPSNIFHLKPAKPENVEETHRARRNIPSSGTQPPNPTPSQSLAPANHQGGAGAPALAGLLVCGSI